MANPQVFEMVCKKPQNVVKNFMIENNVLYFLWGMWNATKLPEDAFERTSEKYEEMRADRPRRKLVLKFYLPMLRLLKYHDNKQTNEIEIHCFKPQATQKLLEWLHARVDEIEAPGGSKGDAEPMVAPFIGKGDEVYVTDHNDYLVYDEAADVWSLNPKHLS